MSLPTNRLGNTDLHITRVGFGAWAVGGGDWAYGWGEQDDAESIAAIRYSIEQGVNWIDTAAVYGLGHSEEVVARALSGLSDADRPFVFTKCGLVWDAESPTAKPPARVMAPSSVRREVEDSLRRLNVETIDLYQVHWPTDDGTPIEEYWQTLADLKASGKVRYIGLSNHDVPALDLAEKVSHVDSLQPPFSAIQRKNAPEIAWCAEHDTGVIVYSPMQSGLLTGAFSAARVASLPENDWRRQSPDFSTGLAANLELAAALEPIALRHDVPVAAVAVAWTLAWPGVTAAIVGARRPAQIDGWLPAASLELSAEDISEIAEAIERTGAGWGPSRP
ncbi:aldo/keto reductase [Lentzea sp. NBRC 105346]|uniref:aldo/keto reductase n=1 Tax=Lentzea sp. NBRC 105346 TaxID=3032205 RepID=UPI00249FB4D3|nr:aldo/keto reductase [Lentzea sp. NBRC 105346]GLZ29982.1 aldo/keto reductase [Lentzea sp. NBRC 105346]